MCKGDLGQLLANAKVDYNYHKEKAEIEWQTNEASAQREREVQESRPRDLLRAAAAAAVLDAYIKEEREAYQSLPTKQQDRNYLANNKFSRRRKTKVDRVERALRPAPLYEIESWLSIPSNTSKASAYNRTYEYA